MFSSNPPNSLITYIYLKNTPSSIYKEVFNILYITK